MQKPLDLHGVQPQDEQNLLVQCMQRVLGAMGRIRVYVALWDRQGPMEPMRQDAIVHNFGIVAHGLLGMQGVQSCKKYDVLLEHWVQVF